MAAKPVVTIAVASYKGTLFYRWIKVGPGLVYRIGRWVSRSGLLFCWWCSSALQLELEL
jgi:hypothetical protein